MKITEQLIEKFFNNACNVVEAELVSIYLDKHPDELDSYLKKDWDEAVPEGEIPEAFWEDAWNIINAKKELEDFDIKENLLDQLSVSKKLNQL